MGGVIDTQQGAQGRASPSSVESLVQMGFSRDLAMNALEASGNDFDSALQMLIDQRETEERNRRASAAEQRASKAIRKTPTNNPPRPAVSATRPALVPSAPLLATQTTAPTAGGFESLILPFAERAQAVDTLFYVLKTIADNPGEAKFRALKTTNARFLETLGTEPRTKAQVETFLGRIGFERAGEWLTLPPNYNRNTLKAALDALSRIQETSGVYQSAKRMLEFEKAIEMSKATANEEERARRAKFAALVPPVPAEGAAGTTRISVIISEGSPPLTRRFVADDTLADVVNWIGSERSVVCQKILEGSWVLRDETLLQKRPLNVHGGDLSKTLHALQLWPSATLNVRLQA